MNTSETVKKLCYVGEITVMDYRPVRDIIRALKEGKANVVNAQWADKWRQENLDIYPLDLCDINIWSTFPGCTRLVFSVQNKKLECEAYIRDGSTFGGTPARPRFDATIRLPLSFISNIATHVNEEFRAVCDDEYDKYLQDRRDKWVKNREKEILLSSKTS